MQKQPPIVRRKLYQEIVDRLEAMIHAKEYSVGDELPPEREIMASFGVGRTSVREALFALQRMGLVTVNRGERARVTEPTSAFLVSELAGAARHLLAQPNGIQHFQKARALFETGLAKYAAEHATAADIETLRKALAANQQAIGDDIRFERTDVAFHRVLAALPQNPIFTAMHDAMASWLLEQRETAIHAKDATLVSYRDHSRIYEAIAAHDPSGAEVAMRDHLSHVETLYWEVRKKA